MTLFKTSWVVEEEVHPTHKQYTAYELKRFIGYLISKEPIFDNGLLSSEAHGNEGLFSRCTFLTQDDAVDAIWQRLELLNLKHYSKHAGDVVTKVVWEMGQ